MRARPTERAEAPPIARPSLSALFLAFAKLSLISFGGGVTALMYREFVVTRRWVAEADFVAGLSLAQSMPGVNVTNLAIWLGSQLRGPAGAVVACLGAFVPCSTVVVALGALLRAFAEIPIGATILAGIAVSALGLSLSMGLRTARVALRDWWCVAVFAVALVVAALHGSVILLVCLLAPISIFLAWRSLPDE